ncbi:MAG: antibiotic biosynthesis monooxygenase [Pseudomonadota bacterium]
MKTITAVIRCKPGTEGTMRDALLAVADHVAANEPETLGFFVSQADDDACVFTTYERFVDDAAMERHNTSAACQRFFEVARPILDGEVILKTCGEISVKP